MKRICQQLFDKLGCDLQLYLSQIKMQKALNQKLIKETKRKLKTYQSLIKNNIQFPENKKFQLDQFRLLRILTSMQINYLLYSYITILEKFQTKNLQQIKIGVIGGGVMGRLILNNLIVFQKQGLDLSNISISTRQPENLQFYKNNFNIETVFENQKIMMESDIIFIATPATLDNWIIVELKDSFQKRCNKKGLKPLVYILTSNMNLNKAEIILGSKNNILIPFINYENLKKQLDDQQNLFSKFEPEALAEYLQKINRKSINSRVHQIYNMFCYIFTSIACEYRNLQAIEQKNNEIIYNCLLKPSFEENYSIKQKRWKSAYYNFIS